MLVTLTLHHLHLSPVHRFLPGYSSVHWVFQPVSRGASAPLCWADLIFSQQSSALRFPGLQKPNPSQRPQQYCHMLTHRAVSSSPTLSPCRVKTQSTLVPEPCGHSLYAQHLPGSIKRQISLSRLSTPPWVQASGKQQTPWDSGSVRMMGPSTPHRRDSPTAPHPPLSLRAEGIWSLAVSDSFPEGRSTSSPVSRAWQLFCNCTINLLWLQHFRDLGDHSRTAQKISNQLNGRSISLNTIFVLKKYLIHVKQAQRTKVFAQLEGKTSAASNNMHKPHPRSDSARTAVSDHPIWASFSNHCPSPKLCTLL